MQSDSRYSRKKILALTVLAIAAAAFANLAIASESDSADTSALVLPTTYDNELTGWMDYFLDFRFFVVNEESGSYTHRLNTGLEFELFSDFDVDVSWVWDRIQDPRQSSDETCPVQDDFRTIVSLGYSF